MYIEQGNTGALGKWKYVPIPIAFFTLMVLNYIVIKFGGIDINAVMSAQISENGKNWFFAENLIPFILFLGGLLCWVKYIHKQSILSLTTSRKSVDWSRVFFMFMLMMIFILSATALSYTLDPTQFEIQFDPIPFAILVVLSIVLIPIQTSFEEYFFRGYLLQGIGVISGNKWLPLITTSILFGLVHSANPEVEKIGPLIMVYYIGTGLFLAIITQMDEGLELALGFHAANNLVTALLVTADWTAFQTNSILIDLSEPSGGYDILIPILVVFPIGILILSRKYKWTDWKTKLFGKIEVKI